jgi:hypothetical protein
MEKETEVNLNSLLFIKDQIKYIDDIREETKKLKLNKLDAGDDNWFCMRLGNIAQVVGLEKFNELLELFTADLFIAATEILEKHKTELDKYKVIKED